MKVVLFYNLQGTVRVQGTGCNRCQTRVQMKPQSLKVQRAFHILSRAKNKHIILPSFSIQSTSAADTAAECFSKNQFYIQSFTLSLFKLFTRGLTVDSDYLFVSHFQDCCFIQTVRPAAPGLCDCTSWDI